MVGWLDPKTQRATAFYLLLGVLCSNIYHTGLQKWNFLALCLMTGLGTVSGLASLLGTSRPPPGDPPGA